MSKGRPSVESVLRVIRNKTRLVEVGREFNVPVPPAVSVDEQHPALMRSGSVRFRELLEVLGRDELKAACKAHGMDAGSRARVELVNRLLGAAGDQVPSTSRFQKPSPKRVLPRVGDVVQVRHRQYFVEALALPPEPEHATKVSLVGLDDDNQGRRLEVLWELELGARVVQPEATGLGQVRQLDAPRFFAAYLHAVQWNAVTATDARLFQAPFRAGIRLLNHQLTPLKKALELPRANLFIADDVGLGKTIEAGLVLQELLLRQRVELILIVCPASVALQWRDEMQKRFGLHFEVMNRAFVARRRRERGFTVNPWSTHARFIVSYQTLRRPEYRDPLLHHVGERARRSLLILDEAHTVAPSSATLYAIDSRTTHLARDLAPRFENRLFLSATPHNGHSNSFSALLEILDPQRFTRGVPVASTKRLEAIMVRRLKDDLRELGVEGYPERKVVQVDLSHDAGRWTARTSSLVRGGEPKPSKGILADADQADLGQGSDVELKLTRLLAEYTGLARPSSARGRLVFTNLQKRLLSSVEAFSRTLEVHAASVAKDLAERDLVQTEFPTVPVDEGEDAEEYGVDDEVSEAEAAGEVARASRFVTTSARSAQLLEQMLELSRRHRSAPDAKVLALVAWIRRHQCPAVRIGGAADGASKKDRAWTDRRVIVFTEYGDTKRYVDLLLRAAIAGTERADERILHFHGGMSDERREEVQRAFNGSPAEYPVRILLCTDAAREGVNLQGHCHDLFHMDVPWNPARMEQRNGRIDRTLQARPEVFCHYFVYRQRTEDTVLETLVRKVDTIQRELGSLGAVVMDRLSAVLERGIDAGTAKDLDRVSALGARVEVTREELEAARRDRKRLRREIDEAGDILDESRKVAEFDARLLRDAIDVGLELAGAKPLQAVEVAGFASGTTFALPELPESWQPTLDTLRPARGRDEPLWEWRKRAPLPVVFHAPASLTSDVVHLHLQHPFVQRILARFLAQGTSAFDLSRVTAVVTPRESTVRVIAFGRLSLFGPGATRLHDQLVSVSAPWFEAGGAKHLKPYKGEKADRRALQRLEEVLAGAPGLDRVPSKVRARLVACSGEDFATLWPHVKDEAEALAHEAERKLRARGSAEAEALRGILVEQRRAIDKTLHAPPNMPLFEADADAAEREQFELDKRHMTRRLDAIEKELADEPPQIEGLYRIALQRLEPVGLVYLWPETRA